MESIKGWLSEFIFERKNKVAQNLQHMVVHEASFAV